jgi:hypothetical protein
MRTHNGNLGAVIADIGPITFAQLDRYKIPYHEVFFGKPWAHIYVDDLAVNANMDTYRELGWLAEDECEDDKLSDNKNAKKAGIVASRNFNHVQIVGEKVIKSSKSNGILGEMYFYAHLPREIVDMFPTIHSLSYLKETAMYSFTMQKLEGSTFSHMSVGRSLTAGRLNFMLKSLGRIHRSKSAEGYTIEPPEELEEIFEEREANDVKKVDIYANYGRKLRQRYDSYKPEYDALGSTRTAKIKRILTTRLDSYEAEKRGISAPVIHGDPVFSNVILNEKEKKIYFYDMRSQMGDVLTPSGDVYYDLAKVLQSLHGYDHVVLADDELLDSMDGDGQLALDIIVSPEDRQLLINLQNEVFWPWVAAEYGNRIRRQDVLDITASLLFSLLPLHKSSVRPVFLQMCENIMEYGMACPL